MLKMIYFIGLFFLLASCGSDEDEILGEWYLQSIETECPDDPSYPDNVTYEPDGRSCLKITTVDTSGSIHFTSISRVCETLIFEADGNGRRIEEDLNSTSTTPFTYSLMEEMNFLEICYPNMTCTNYEFINDQIVVSVDFTSLSGLECNITLAYGR